MIKICVFIFFVSCFWVLLQISITVCLFCFLFYYITIVHGHMQLSIYFKVFSSLWVFYVSLRLFDYDFICVSVHKCLCVLIFFECKSVNWFMYICYFLGVYVLVDFICIYMYVYVYVNIYKYVYIYIFLNKNISLTF